jgi:hypothetical protein
VRKPRFAAKVRSIQPIISSRSVKPSENPISGLRYAKGRHREREDTLLGALLFQIKEKRGGKKQGRN